MTDFAEDDSRERYLEQLQAIHQLRDELELDDSEYRELLSRLTGLRSSKLMTDAQRDQVIAFMYLHRQLDELVARAEEARESLNRVFPKVAR